MTPQEALYWCEQFENNVVKADPQREKMVLALQAMKECKKALEKQTPKKPYVINDEWAKCPSCKSNMIEHREPHFCEHCGQALDWSDTE